MNPSKFPISLKAVAFDLGDTLVEYEGIPLNWEVHYPAALANLASSLGLSVTPAQIHEACAVLRRYNTRLNPRETEVLFSTILREILTCFSVSAAVDIPACAGAFFQIFRQRLRCFPEAQAVLANLQVQQIKVGIFTDVPYGMPQNLVLNDLHAAGLDNHFHVLLTSCDTGCRKPSPVTLQALATKLNCSAAEMIYVGNERKDIQAARAFGCYAILIDRHQSGATWGQDRTITSLSELSTATEVSS
jgi:putative hydrolase of the HAD superfamily